MHHLKFYLLVLRNEMLLKTHRFFALMYVEVSHADSAAHLVCTFLKGSFMATSNRTPSEHIACNNESDCLESIKEGEGEVTCWTLSAAQT